MNQIFIANLGLYNEGYLEGDWFELGQDEEELTTFLKENVGINEKYEEWFIADTDLEGLDMHISEYDDVYQLNEMFNRYNILTSYEQEIVQAILELGSYTNLDDAIEQIDSYCLFSDINNYEDLGYAYVHEWGCVDVDRLGFITNYIDYEALGRDIDLDSSGGFTTKGYLSN